MGPCPRCETASLLRKPELVLLGSADSWGWGWGVECAGLGTALEMGYVILSVAMFLEILF